MKNPKYTFCREFHFE